MNDLEKAQFNILWGVQRSIRYHDRRRLFIEHILLFASVLFTSSGTASICVVWIHTDIPILIPVYLLALLLVYLNVNYFKYNKLILLHNDLYKRFISLEKSINEIQQPTNHDIHTLESIRLYIEADEPPVLKVLDIICHNELLRAYGYNSDKQVEISELQRILANFFDYKEHTIKFM